MAEVKVDLFLPGDGIHFLDEYPELQEYPELRNLSNEDLLFSYYYACPTSHIVQSGKPDKQKIQASIIKAYGHKLDDKKKTKFLNKNFPEPVRQAVERFSKFRPSSRMRAKLMVDKMFDTYESILDVSKEQDELMKSDPDEAKKYVDLSTKILNVLPNLVKQKENAFGVMLTAKEIEEGVDGPSLYDEITS